ncbi:uncharacterized protein LOC119678977 [Teleopsis dalmanni]|uniref:uncharacterized protein LOC119678977 n=1 Tax=Teleopsis dalmanni TaxID=139649 RepID=UPI0018CC8E22|nr:uncharacterized protein LOC119678977 [Teleopsis dalmanni]
MKRCSDEQQLAQSESSDLLFQQVINDEDETFAKTTTKTKTKTKTPAMSKNLAHLDIIYKNMSHQIANSSNDTLNAIATLDVLIDHQQICSDVRDTSLLVEVPVAVGTASETYPSIRLVLAQAISHENSLHKASILEKTESSAAEVTKNVSDCATPEKLTKEIQGLGKNIDESRQTEVINEKCVKSEKTDMTITKSISVESEEEYITESLTSSGIGAEELTEVEVNEMKYEMKSAESATTQGRSSYKSDVPSSVTVRSKTPNSGLSDTKNIKNDYSSSRLKNEIVTPTQTRLNTSIGFNSNRVKIDPKNPESVRTGTNVGYSSNAGVKSEPITHNVTTGTTNTYNKHNSNILSSTRNPPITPYNSKNDVIQSSVPRRSSASAAPTKRGVIDYTELGLRDTTNKRHSSGMDYTKDLSERVIRETANKRHSTGMDYTKDLTELGVREACNKRHSTGIDYTKDLTEFGLRDAANKRYSTGIDYTKDLSDFGTVKTPRKESEIKHSYSVDAMPSSLPTSTRLRRQRRMYSQDSADDSESALEKLNRLRARISGALSEVKGVLKQYSTETEAESDNTLDNKNILESKKVDDGPVQFRFVKKVRRRSFFNEADEDAVKTVAENNATETKTEAMNSEIVSNKSAEEIKPININEDSQDSESGKLLDLKTVAANEESLDLNNNEAKTVSENEKLENKSDESCNKINNNYITSAVQLQAVSNENQISEQNLTSTIDEVDKAVSGSAKNDLNVMNAQLQVVEHTRRLSPKLKNKDTNNKKSASEKLLPNSESINSVNKNKNKNLNLNSEVQNIESKRKLSPKLNKQETNKKIPLKVEENTKPSIHIKKDTSPMHENKKLNVESLKSESTADSSLNNNSHKKLVPNKNENSQISTTVADSSPNNNSHKKLVLNDNEKSQIRTTVAKNEAELNSIKNETTKTSIINNNKLTKSKKLENEAVAMTEKIPTIKLEQGQQNDEKTLQITVVEKSEKELIETISNVENLATPSLQQNSADNIISENKVTKLRSQNKNSNEPEKKRLSLKRNDSEIRRASIAAVEISKIIPSFDEETSVEIKLERRPSDSTAVVKKKVQGTSTKFASVMENDLATKVKKVTKVKRSSVKKNATDADVIAAVATTAHQQNTILTTNQITTEAKEAKTSATSIVVDNGELINENSLCNNKMLPITRTATQTPTEKPIINNQTKSMPNDASLTIAEVPMMPMMPIMPTTTTNDATEVIKSQNQNSVPQNLEISPTLQVPLQDGTVRSNSESAELKVVCETRTEPNNSEKLVKNIIKSKSEQDEKLTPPEKLITSTEENKYIDAEKIQNKTTTLIHSQELLDIKKPINQEIIPSETHDKQAQSSESQQVSIAAIANTNAAILQSENSTSADAVNERFKDATPKIISIATNVDATTKTESIDTAPNSVQVIVECNATDTSEETTTATEETMPELQVLPAPVVTAPQVGHKEHHSGKKKVIIKKLIRQCSKDKTITAPPKANENTSLIGEANIENNDINVIPPEELENAIEITTIETDVEVSTSEIEIPVAPPKKPRRVKKKVIIKRQQRKLSIGDTFFRGPEEEPVVSEIETLEKPIAYVTDDEDDDSMKEKNDEPVQPLKSCMKSREYQIGDIVLYAERFKKTQIRWKKGRVIERITSISYMLDIDGKEVPSHVNYLKKFTERKVNFGGKEYLEIDYEQIEEEERLARTYSIWNMV